MFNNLKEKIYADVKNVKEILLSDINKVEKDIVNKDFKRVNFKAGSNIKKHFQALHEDVHSKNFFNDRLAENVSKDIELIHKTCLTDSKNLTDLTTLFKIVGSVIEKCNDQLETLKISFESIELGLINLEETINQIERQNKENVLCDS